MEGLAAGLAVFRDGVDRQKSVAKLSGHQSEEERGRHHDNGRVWKCAYVQVVVACSVKCQNRL